MKIFKNCTVGGQELDLAEEYLVLELSAAGRGFVTVKTDESQVGKEVLFEVGTYDALYKWFLGVVESEEEAEPSYKKLFIREKCSALNAPLSCSLRHVTLRDVAAWLNGQTGLTFKIPQASYADEPIALFTHSGNGYQLLANIGRQYQIPDFMWQQDAEGAIFVGSHQDSRWAGKNVELDTQVSLSAGSNDMTLPISAAIRPAALINGNKIKRVELRGDEYSIFWDSLDKDGNPEKSPAKRQMEQNFPELAGGYHLPKYAKVVGVADPSTGGDISDPFRPKYAVELQLLDENGNEDKTTPTLPSVPLPVTSTGSQGGDFSFPEVGTMVEIGFAYGRSDKPFIRTMLAQGKTLPAVAVGEQLKQQRPEVFERTDSAGNKTRQTDQAIIDKSYTRQVIADQEQKELGQSTATIDSDYSRQIGGNRTIATVGAVQDTTASNRTNGTGGNLMARIEGVAEQVSGTKNKLVAPLSYMGSEGQNIFRILEETLQIVKDLAQTCADHTHQNAGETPQKSTFSGYASRASAEKNKLTPIIE